MNSQTDNQELLAGLDFDVTCGIRWGKWVDGHALDVGTVCGEKAISNVTFINGYEDTRVAFMCPECLALMRQSGRLLNVTYI